MKLKEDKIKLKYIELTYGIKYECISDVADIHRTHIEFMLLTPMLKFVIRQVYGCGGRGASMRKIAQDYGCHLRVVQNAIAAGRAVEVG